MPNLRPVAKALTQLMPKISKNNSFLSVSGLQLSLSSTNRSSFPANTELFMSLAQPSQHTHRNKISPPIESYRSKSAPKSSSKPISTKPAPSRSTPSSYTGNEPTTQSIVDEAVAFAKQFSITMAAKKFNKSKATIHRWVCITSSRRSCDSSL